jgi:hypothetical protein
MIHDWHELDLHSMDLILCKGNSKMSRAIQKFQKYTGAEGEAAGLSHVAGMFGHDAGFLYESTTFNKWAYSKGVQRNPMNDWLAHYDGEVYVRKLDFKRESPFQKSDFLFYYQHCSDEYESGIPGAIELLLCGLRLHRYVRRLFPNYTPRFTSEPHCTELQAKRLKHHSLMLSGVAINRLPPWMWWDEIDKYLTCSVGKPIRIK